MYQNIFGSAALAALLPALVAAVPAAVPAPAPEPTAAPEVKHAVVRSALLGGIVSGAQSEAAAVSAGFSSGINQDVPQFISAYENIYTGATVSQSVAPAPTDAVELKDRVSSIFAAKASAAPNVIKDSLELVLNSFDSEYLHPVEGELSGQTQSWFNINVRSPAQSVYPTMVAGDAPYSLTEAQLRAALYFPPDFTYGLKKPVILMPGTGATGGSTFAGNFIPALKKDGRFDMVYVNVPGYMLGDAQTNAEYAAYALNYVAGITGRKVSAVSWSQGGLSIQWALKYWPSTRAVVEDFIPISPDFKGTVNQYLICPNLALTPCTPSIVQQGANSEFICKLRETDGDSAYVPTTSVYSSIFDEIVEPQTGTAASAFMKDVRNVGVTNNEVQAICPGELGGSFYTHELTLANPVAIALAIDAMTHDGPGQISRLDLNSLCPLYLAPGLSVVDGISTQANLLQAFLTLVAYEPKLTYEPAIRPYATY